MSDAGVEQDVSREKLEKELQGIEGAIDDMEERVKDIEDRDMMAQLESLSLEEEVQEVEELLNHMSKEELEKRLNMVEQIREEYQEGKVHEKLEYLYRQIKELKEQQHDTKGAASNVEKLRERMDRLEQRVEGNSPGENNTTEIPEKYRKAVRSNYKELKKLRDELDGKSDSDIAELEDRIEELEYIKDRLKQMESQDEVVFIDKDEDISSSENNDDLSSIEFDIKSIKSRVSKLEENGASSRIDETNIQRLRKKVKKLEKKVENKESAEIQAFKNNIEQRVKETERNTVSEQEVDKQIEEFRNSIENQLRRLDSEIDRAVREGEERIQNLETVVEDNVLDELEENDSDLSERIDMLMDIILDNQDYIEQLDQELEGIDQRQQNKVDFEELEKVKSELKQTEREIEEGKKDTEKDSLQNLRNKVQQLEKELTERDGIELENLKRKVEELDTDNQENEQTPKSNLEKKIDNLAEHVIRNQEKLHQLEQKMSMEGSAHSSDDVTIIS
jgi:chromosome segregation ATPase